MCIKIPQTVHGKNGKLVPHTLPLSFYVVSPFLISSSYSWVFPKSFSSNSSIGLPEDFPLFSFMPLPLQDLSLFFAQKFMLQSLDDFGMFLLEPLASFPKRIYITCKSQEDYRTYEIEEIIADHNILIMNNLSYLYAAENMIWRTNSPIHLWKQISPTVFERIDTPMKTFHIEASSTFDVLTRGSRGTFENGRFRD